MGVDGLNTYIKTKYNIFKQYDVNKGEKPTHLYIDFNNILHVCGKSNYKTGFYKQVNNHLGLCCQNFNPSELMFIAIDGPGPYSKLVEQRKRRWTSSLKSSSKDPPSPSLPQPHQPNNHNQNVNLNLNENISNSNNNNNTNNNTTTTKYQSIKRQVIVTKNISKNAYESVMLTPGSRMMGEIKERVTKFSDDAMRTILNTKQLIISAADSKGEGEWKIFHHINNVIEPNSKNRIFVLSDDSDLLLYALLSNIQVYIIHNRTKEFIDSFELKKLISNDCPKKDSKQVIIDFVMLCFCNGSDYLPRLGGYNFEKTWDRYCNDDQQDGIFNIDTNQFNWKCFLRCLNIKSRESGEEIPKFEPPPIRPNEISRFNSAVSMIRGYNKSIPAPVIEIVRVEPLKTIASVVFLGQRYESKARSEKEAKLLLLTPLVQLDHPFWLKYLPLLPPVHRSLIERALLPPPPLPDDNTINNININNNNQQYSIELITKYFESIAWSVQYARTNTQNYTYYYHYARPPMSIELVLADQLNLSINPNLNPTNPFTPLQFQIALSNVLTKHTIPKIFHSMIDIDNHYDYMNGSTWNNEDAVSSLQKVIDQVIQQDGDKLNPYEKSQLMFHNSKIFIKSSSNNQLKCHEIDLYNLNVLEQLKLNQFPSSLSSSTDKQKQQQDMKRKQVDKNDEIIETKQQPLKKLKDHY